MQTIQQLLTNDPVLKYFDPNKYHLQVDASQCGLGAGLLQEGHPVSMHPGFLPLLNATTHK